jgi:hypothetical protein
MNDCSRQYKDGKLTMEEMLAFMHGTKSPAPQQ